MVAVRLPARISYWVSQQPQYGKCNQTITKDVDLTILAKGIKFVESARTVRRIETAEVPDPLRAHDGASISSLSILLNEKYLTLGHMDWDSLS